MHLNPPKMTPAMRRKVSAGVRRYYASRGRRSVSVVHARPVRRFRGRASSSARMGSLMSSFRSAFSRPLLMKAGGAVIASIGTGFILNRWGASLPLANNTYGKLVYTMGIPVLGAWAIHRKSRDLAEGMVIGGLVMSINALMTTFNVSSIIPAAAPAATPAVSSYSVAGELGRGQPFGYYPQGMRDTRALGGANVAFPPSAW